MKTYPAAAPFILNHDGTAALVGYEVLRHIDLVTGQETAWPLNGQGAWYVAGWFRHDQPMAFQPTNASPPMTKALHWDPTSGIYAHFLPDHEAVGHAGLMVVDGDVLSTNGTTLWHNGQDITPPEPFSGVVWAGKDYYGYELPNSGFFRTRRLRDNGLVLNEFLGAEQRPYAIGAEPWVSGYDYEVGGVEVVTPTQRKWIVGEIPGPIFEHAGVVYVVTGIMGSQNNPRGVMVRPWSEFKADGKGYYLDGIRHQFLQARVRGDRFVVAGAEFPGAGILTVGEIDPSSPMTVVPPEHVELPGPAPIPDLTLDVPPIDLSRLPGSVAIENYTPPPALPRSWTEPSWLTALRALVALFRRRR